MAELSKDVIEGSDAFEELPVQVNTSHDPFDGDSQKFSWPRQVNIGQLQIEVTEALGEQVRLAFILPVGEDGVDEPIDDDHPLVVYVTPSSADLAAVRQVMAAHRPDPYYGMSDEERQAAQLQEKVASGAELSLPEMQQALRLLMG
ncbi:hypothetical protein [Streptomyces sp. cg35]|uniref:hypothetical protein n=1 Tax=Streptomyces sp. cg35 TaxID=3421650 RepID=UPI003D169C91